MSKKPSLAFWLSFGGDILRTMDSGKTDPSSYLPDLTRTPPPPPPPARAAIDAASPAEPTGAKRQAPTEDEINAILFASKTKEADHAPVNPIAKSFFRVALVLFALWAVPAIFFPKYEYMIQAINDKTFNAEMDAIGSKGWEAVSSRRASDGSTYNPKFSYEIIFKRRKMF